MLVKIRVSPEQRQAIMAVTDIYHGKVVDVTHDSMIVEITGRQEKLQAFINLIDDYEVLEVASTGLTGLVRGTDALPETRRKLNAG